MNEPVSQAGPSDPHLELAAITAECEGYKVALGHTEESLEHLARGEPLREVLEHLLLSYEALYPGMLGSVLVLNRARGTLSHIAGPSLAPGYLRAIDGVEIGPMVGSCGTAAFSGSPVMVADIENDPLWRNFKDLALSYELRACWSTPILDPSGSVTGTCAFYFRAVREALPADLASLQRGASLASVAIERQRSASALQASESRTRRLLQAASVGLWDWDLGTQEVYFSPEWKQQLGYADHELPNAFGEWESRLHKDDLAPTMAAVRDFREGRRPTYAVAFRLLHKDGSWRWIAARADHARDETGAPIRMMGSHIDITEQKRFEAEKLRLETELHQAQRMESVGRLAGGVAHDFNNMLGVILGNLELVMQDLDPALPIFADLEEVRKAARRSADLTGQLLSFARRQSVAPKVIALNEVVEGMLKMLRRLIGAGVQLQWLPVRALWSVNVDPSQVDQILANLCLNARDAIVEVGTVTIRTENVSFDDGYCLHNEGFSAGDYVMLSVADDGRGMDGDTVVHVFEPFFTTKAVGAGTGLGLATVYGVVRQNDGFIRVVSQPGVGTTFKVYLPRHLCAVTEPVRGPTLRVPGGKETILLVEDEPAVLRLASRVLQGEGYTVLAAGGPSEALRVAGSYPGDIHLLVTDVVMPEMYGPELARRLVGLYPRVKRLFMSGYAANLATEEAWKDDVVFLQKPFSTEDLAAKVREALGAATGPAGPPHRG